MSNKIIKLKEIEYELSERKHYQEKTAKEKLVSEELSLKNAGYSLAIDRDRAALFNETFPEFIKDSIRMLKEVYKGKDSTAKIMSSLFMFSFVLIIIQSLMLTPILTFVTMASMFAGFEVKRALIIGKIKKLDKAIFENEKKLEAKSEEVKNFLFTITNQQLNAMKREIVEMHLREPRDIKENEEDILAFIEQPKTFTKKR
jgi:hypothetical protein